MFSTLPNPNFNVWVTSILLHANALRLDQFKNFFFQETKQQKIRMTQIESFYRRHKCDLKIAISVGRIENIVGKAENAGYQHFLLFLRCFRRASFFKVVKIRDCSVSASHFYFASCGRWGFENLHPWAIFSRPCFEKHSWALQFSICCKLSKLTIKRKEE